MILAEITPSFWDGIKYNAVDLVLMEEVQGHSITVRKLVNQRFIKDASFKLNGKITGVTFKNDKQFKVGEEYESKEIQ